MQIVKDIMTLKEKAENDGKYGIIKTLQNMGLTILFHHWKQKFDGFDTLLELNEELQLLDNKIEGSLTTGFNSSGGINNAQGDYKFFREECIGKKSDVENTIHKQLKRRERKLKDYATKVGLGHLFSHEVEEESSVSSPAVRVFVCNSCCKFNMNKECECIK